MHLTQSLSLKIIRNSLNLNETLLTCLKDRLGTCISMSPKKDIKIDIMYLKKEKNPNKQKQQLIMKCHLLS